MHVANACNKQSNFNFNFFERRKYTTYTISLRMYSRFRNSNSYYCRLCIRIKSRSPKAYAVEALYTHKQYLLEIIFYLLRTN